MSERKRKRRECRKRGKSRLRLTVMSDGNIESNVKKERAGEVERGKEIVGKGREREGVGY